MNITLEEVRIANKAVKVGLISKLQYQTAMTECVQDPARNDPGVRSLKGALVAARCLREEQWAGLLEDSRNGAVAPSPSSSKRSFGKYVIERELGRGGIGVVYEALDTKSNQKVALKVLNLRPEEEGREVSEQRFLQEFRLLAVLPRHPSIVSVYEAGLIEGHRTIAMELVDGVLLSDWQETVALQDRMKVLAKVALALHHAHGHGIIHRDLRPGNVLIRRDNTPVVLDFGLATPEQRNLRLDLTPQGFMVGSPGFMSPEQARGLKCVDRTSDVYSLGAMLFQMITGRMPFEGKTPLEILVKSVEHPAPRLSTVLKKGFNPPLLGKLEAICAKALASCMKDRYQTSKSFGEDIWKILDPIAGPVLAS